MTISDTLCQGVDNMFKCSLPARISTFALIPLAIILQGLGLGTNKWIKSDDHSSLGLWTYCYDIDKYSCCQDVADKFGDSPGWIVATQVFQCMSCFVAATAMVLMVLYTCVTKTLMNNKVNLAAMVFCSITAIFLLISISIYVDNYRSSALLEDHFLSWTFVLVLAALLLYVIIAVVLLMMFCKERSTVSPTADNQVPVATPSRPPVQVVVPQTINVRPSAPTAHNDENLCVICIERPKQVIFLECGHNVCCSDCSETLMGSSRECPMCREFIERTRRVYR